MTNPEFRERERGHVIDVSEDGPKLPNEGFEIDNSPIVLDGKGEQVEYNEPVDNANEHENSEPVETANEHENSEPVENEHENYQPDNLRRSTRPRKETRAQMEHRETEETFKVPENNQLLAGRKRSGEGEPAEGTVDGPPDRKRLALARIAVATELLLYDNEDELSRKAAERDGITIPKSYQEAVQDPVFGNKWREAIHTEIQSLINFGTWRVIDRNRAHGTISSAKWVFALKVDADGRVERFKARLVARGFQQREDIDFDETFAPVFRLESLRSLAAVAAQNGMYIHIMDGQNAFAGSDLDKPNYMEIPDGLQDFSPDAGDENVVLELKKSIYGLRQSAHLWNKKLTDFLKKIGFKGINADPSIFVNDRGLMVAVYVDDILIAGKNEKEIENVKSKLKKFHPMKDGGRVEKILGIRFTWEKDFIRLDQQAYAQAILEEFGMADCRPAATPMSPSVQLDNGDSARLNKTNQTISSYNWKIDVSGDWDKAGHRVCSKQTVTIPGGTTPRSSNIGQTYSKIYKGNVEQELILFTV